MNLILDGIRLLNAVLVMAQYNITTSNFFFPSKQKKQISIDILQMCKCTSLKNLLRMIHIKRQNLSRRNPSAEAEGKLESSEKKDMMRQ